MSLHQRVRRLEAVEVTPATTAAERVHLGTATDADFEEVIGPDKEGLRTIVVARSWYFRRVRDSGWEPWAWFAADVAASITAVPADKGVDERLVAALAEQAGLRPSKGLSTGADKLLPQMWRSASVMLVLLGSADGLPLRQAVAAGLYSDAVEQVVAWGGSHLLDASINCPPWYRLDCPAVRGVGKTPLGGPGHAAVAAGRVQPEPGSSRYDDHLPPQ